MPDHATAPVMLAILQTGLATLQALNRLVHGAELLIATRHLDGLPTDLHEQCEVAHDVQQVRLVEHARHQPLLLGQCGNPYVGGNVFFSRRGHGLPAGKVREKAANGAYRLHPRLREYLQDHLQLFPAFQSLADIGAKITLLKSLWDEVELVRGDRESVVGMIDELQTTVLDIGDTMNRNMLQLQILMSTRYGNVRSLEAKKSQNRFCQKQTSALSGDVQRLAREAERVEREASIRGRDDLARFIRRQLLTNMMSWQHGLSDMQTFLRNEIYRLRVVEQDLKLLARTDMLLRQ